MQLVNKKRVRLAPKMNHGFVATGELVCQSELTVKLDTNDDFSWKLN